jgi:hypothetical protein
LAEEFHLLEIIQAPDDFRPLRFRALKHRAKNEQTTCPRIVSAHLW